MTALTFAGLWFLSGIATVAYVAWIVRVRPPLTGAEITAFIALGPLTFIAMMLTRKEQTHG